MLLFGKYKIIQKNIVVKGLALVVFLAIIASQIVWLDNMYDLYQREFTTSVDETVRNAIFMELSERSEKLGGFSVYSLNFSPSNDTSRFFTKDLVTADSIYTLYIDKYDHNAMHKITQFVLKSNSPIDLDRLSAIFNENIHNKYAISAAFFDYLDLLNDTLIYSSNPESFISGRYILTDTIPLDIINSIGVVGHVVIPQFVILDKMSKQLMLSILLIIIGLTSLFYISRSFVFQWKAEKMRQESVNAMTHEFKRPISNVVAMLSALQHYIKKDNTNRVLEYLENTMIELNKLTHYTKRIQQISNNEAGKVMLDKTAVEMIPFFESLQQRYSNTNADGLEPEVSINLQLNTLKKMMVVDLLHFSNVMDNLVENAIKYTVHTPVLIDITVEDKDGGDLQISVKDNGIGISEADRRYIFDKYYRVKRGETKNKTGFGLGLTYVKSIIESHGGGITVKSELNNGSEFIIQLDN